MSIESSRSSSIDGQWIRENEAKEFKYGYSNGDETKTAYQRAVERLALDKIKNELIFNGKLEAQLRAFARDGITISREQLISDINKEVARQRVNYDFGSEMTMEMPNVDIHQSDEQAQIDRLKNDLGSIFGGTSQKTETSSMPTENESTKKNDVNENQANQKFNSQIEREEYFDEMYDAEIQKLVELKKNNDPNYEIELNNTIQKILSFTDRIPNAREQIEADIRYQLGKIEREKAQNQDQQNKESLINGILQKMAAAGEFSHIPLEDVSQRIDTMNMVKKRLQEKSIEELEIIFNSYMLEDEKTESSGIHR